MSLSTYQSIVRLLLTSALVTGASVAAYGEDCGLDPVSPDKDMGFICTTLKSLGVSNCTPSGTVTCKRREVFSGLQIELANPKNLKSWSGFGGGGVMFATASMCMLKDIKDAAITPQTAVTSLPGTGGDVSYSQRIEFGGWSHAPDGTLEALLYERTQLTAPVVGTIDAFVTPFRVKTVKSPGNGAKVGEYTVLNALGLEVAGQTYDQKVDASMVAFEVVTPYGAVKVTPEFHVKRQLDFSPTPADWRSEAIIATSMSMMKTNSVDVLDRLAGIKRSQLMPDAKIPDTLAAGWVGQAGLGSRNPVPDTNLWSAGTVVYPLRPDRDLAIPRLDFERQPDISASAAVKVAYSITDMLPSAITHTPVLNADLEVYAEPEINVAGSSQIGLWSHEGRLYTGKPVQVNDKLTLTPADPSTFATEHLFEIDAGPSASAGYALKAGFVFRIDLHVNIGFFHLNKTLININPDTTIAKAVNQKKTVTTRAAQFLSTSEHFKNSGQIFERLKTVSGADRTQDQAAYLKMCLAQPSQTPTPPTPPGYTPGDPSQLLDELEMPCNICVGMQDTTYTDPFGKTVAVQGFPPTVVQPVSQNGHVKWTCGWGTLGCYDMCKLAAGGSSFSLKYTAPESPVPITDSVSGKQLMCRTKS